MTTSDPQSHVAMHAAGRIAVPSLAVQGRGPLTAAGMPRTAKIIRIAVMAQELLEEIHRAPLDQAGQARLRDAFDASVGELSGCLPPRLAAELDRLIPAKRRELRGDDELRVAQAQLAGWLEGLFQAIKASLDAQQAATLRRLVEQSDRDRPTGE
jgi:hypothetical protein